MEAGGRVEISIAHHLSYHMEFTTLKRNAFPALKIGQLEYFVILLLF